MRDDCIGHVTNKYISRKLISNIFQSEIINVTRKTKRAKNKLVR